MKKILILLAVVLIASLAGWFWPMPDSPLVKDLTSYLDSATKSGAVEIAAVYVEDLTTGESININGDEVFTPGSVMKVAPLMVYLRDAETDPSILTRLFPYDPSKNNYGYYPPQDLGPKGNYSAETLLVQLITQSDDAALTIALPYEKQITELYEALHMPVTPSQAKSAYITPKQVSQMFIALYTGAYMSQDLSAQALTLLSQTHFDQGLVAYVAYIPTKKVPVSHKFGEHTLYTGYMLNQEGNPVPDPKVPVHSQMHGLNDCGIVNTTRPYVICVMTKGKDFKELEQTIADVSLMVYTARNPTKL